MGEEQGRIKKKKKDVARQKSDEVGHQERWESVRVIQFKREWLDEARIHFGYESIRTINSKMGASAW